MTRTGTKNTAQLQRRRGAPGCRETGAGDALRTGKIDASYAWPLLEPLDAARTALIVIDMQSDFCAPGGWVDQLGEDVSSTRAAIAPVARLLAAARTAGLTVVHTREGHRPDLSDLNPNKRWRTRHHGLGIGDTGACGRILVRGEPGHDIVPECAPLPGELVIDKPGKGSFFATGLESALRARGVTAVIVCGVTSDCCVQATFRDAGELGFDALFVTDATAAVEAHHHSGTAAILAALGGRWGATARLVAVLAGLEKLH